MDGVRITDRNSTVEIRVFPDELPVTAAELTDDLISLFAPLSSWRDTAVTIFTLVLIILGFNFQSIQVEYFRQGMHDEFRSVLLTVVNLIDSQGMYFKP